MMPRVRTVRRSAGGLVAALWRTGLLPAAAHVLATQRVEQCDPVFHATLEPVKAYASFVWEQRISLGRLQRAWEVVNQQFREKANWADARGPISVLWLALARTAWSVLSSTVLCDDNQHTIDAMRIPSRSVLSLVKDGAQR
eukprot:710434-Pyramimonas_sp.AAC.1